MKFKPCPFCGSTDIVLATIPAWPTSCYELICADCNVAIHAEDTKSVCALWNRRYEPPNPPLTLDELREMEGEPVWYESLLCLPANLASQWAIVRKDEVLLPNGSFLPFAYYGRTWKACRRKPEEE